MLMFDYGEPKSFPPRDNAKPLGVGKHPHRGFETVTVAFQGEAEHHDSIGGHGIIKEGDIQWMTAGRGIIHEEYHSKKFTSTGGIMEMCQLWVNLPKQYKMTPPKYQDIQKERIPSVNIPAGIDDEDNKDNKVLGSVRIIAGEFNNVTGPASTFSPVQMWDITLPHEGTEVDLPYPANHNCIVFIRRGSIEIISGDLTTTKSNKTQKVSKLNPQDVALMEMDGSNQLRIRVMQPNTSVLILGGEPLNEPIAARGPFVMNTEEEIYEAMSDYRMGKMGR
jgi:quercetin 2,3-dioxygenase